MQNLQNYTHLSVREFKEMCDTMSPSRFIFSSENQLRNEAKHLISIQITFSVMLIAFNPNAVCFKNSQGNLCLDRVKYVRKENDGSTIGTIFTIICGDFDNEKDDEYYTIVVR